MSIIFDAIQTTLQWWLDWNLGDISSEYITKAIVFTGEHTVPYLEYLLAAIFG